jgi:hypothetical protein
MKSIIAGVLASVATLGLLSACGGNDLKLTVPTTATIPTDATLPTNATLPTGLTLPTGVTLPAGVTLPDNITIPPGLSIPTDFTVPDAAIDAMIASLTAAGMNVDKDCFVKLLSDDSLRTLVTAGGTPSPEVLQKFLGCVKSG